MAARTEPVSSLPNLTPLLSVASLPRSDTLLPGVHVPGVHERFTAKKAENAAVTAFGFVKEMTSDPDATRATRAALAAATAAFCVTVTSELEIRIAASKEEGPIRKSPSLFPAQKTKLDATRIATNSISTDNNPQFAIDFARVNSKTPTLARKALQVISAARNALLPDETKIAAAYANAAAYAACVADPHLSKEAASIIGETPFPAPTRGELISLSLFSEPDQALIDNDIARVADKDDALFALAATAVLEDGKEASEEHVDKLRSAFQSIQDADVDTAANVAAFFAERALQRLSTSPAIKSARKT